MFIQLSLLCLLKSEKLSPDDMQGLKRLQKKCLLEGKRSRKDLLSDFELMTGEPAWITLAFIQRSEYSGGIRIIRFQIKPQNSSTSERDIIIFFGKMDGNIRKGSAKAGGSS
ncbi:hypothetical protein BCY86_02920 [Pajaroellobacter abortibovis]|uniref:Uncharacterized protein n=1 Tax=Pajaroellobacter abortibovis TaxID=1882918 RepID=A0A1L6MW35_9BACT|nr:hypothetical protein BCY86_02920 [Pajaroellobacter abortibovis]